MNSRFEINQNAHVTKVQLADDDNFIVIIDDFLVNPDEVVNFARHTAYFEPVGSDGTYYPGVRDNMPAPYGRALREALLPIISDYYYDGGGRACVDLVCKLSIVTLQSEQLIDEQKIPHIDSSDENAYAMVHYLCDESHGGTSLYRYKPTGEVKIANDPVNAMKNMTRAAKELADEHGAYLNGDTSLFERVGGVSAKFNRLVLYKSNLLHCADIQSEKSCQKDISVGRLSVASFMFFEAH